MDPAFPDIVGEWAARGIDDKTRVWTVTRGADGRLEEHLDPSRLAEAMIIAEGERELAETRAW